MKPCLVGDDEMEIGASPTPKMDSSTNCPHPFRDAGREATGAELMHANPYRPWPARITSITELTPTEKLFDVDVVDERAQRRDAQAARHQKHVVAAHLVDGTELTPTEKLFEFRFVDERIREAFRQEPGQFVELSIFGVGEATSRTGCGT